MSEALKNRFWSKVVRGPECWEWQAARGADGYGVIKVSGRLERSHRVSWFLERGTWPTGELRHLCGNRGCVRLDHLEEQPIRTSTRLRGPRGAGHIERRGSSWRIVITAGRNPVSGAPRRVTKTVHVATEVEARAEAARLLTELHEGHHDTHGKHTFGELLDSWLKHVTPGLEPGTAALYGYSAGYVTPALRGKPVTSVTAEDLDALYRWLLAHGSTGSGRSDRKGKPLAAKTVKQVHSVIRLALAQGKKWRWVTSNVAVEASPPVAHKRQAAPPTDEAVLGLLSFIDDADPMFSLFLRLAATAGPRRGEMCALRWSAVDLERSTVRVLGRIVWNKSEHRWEERESTKTGKDRRVVLGPRTLELLRAHRAIMIRRAEGSYTAVSPDAFVFSDEPDCSKAWSPQRMTRTFAAYRNRAGLPSGFRLHDLRAFLSTRLQEAGHPLPVVSGRLGHSQYSTTLDHYTGLMPAADRAAAEYMDSLIDGHTR